MQEEGCLTFVIGPTNTGKTFYAIERMLTYSSGIIGLPLRLLAREVYDKLVSKRNKLSIALITGEEQIIPSKAKYFVCTVEAMPSDRIVDFIAVDEIQLCNDYERGHIFTERLLHSRGNLETLFLGSDTMENIIKKLFPKSSIIKKSRRSELTYTGKVRLDSLQERSAIIAFKISDVYDIAARIKATKGGAAVVLGALSPQTRNSQVSLYEEGSVDYIVATDAIGMGLNLNINNVSFSSLKKYDGKKLRDLKSTEMAQIAGRAGRNKQDGFFSNTLSAPNLSRELIDSIEKNNFDFINFLYWRNRDLDFSSIKALLDSLNVKSPNSFLVKTLNTREENILKYLTSVKNIEKYLSQYDNIKLLWEISSIPDYIKTLDYNYTDLLIKIFINIVQNDFIDPSWVLNEVLKLKSVDGTIDTITFRLSKIRFWNYIANRNHWFKKNDDIKNLAKQTENILSKSLHEKLIEQFVDQRLHILAKEIHLDKKLDIRITKTNDIFLNNIKVGFVKGLVVKFINKESLEKNKSIYEKIKSATSKIINDYVSKFIAIQNFEITLDNNLSLYYKNNKIGSLFRGENFFSPKFFIPQNDFLDKNLYNKFEKKINEKLKKLISKAFWDQNLEKSIDDKSLKAILFSLNENLGILEKKKFGFLFSCITKTSTQNLLKNKVSCDDNNIYYSKVLEEKEKKIRWIISSLFFFSKNIPVLPKEKVFKNTLNFHCCMLHSIGYIKLKKYAASLSVIQDIFKTSLSQKKSVYIFNFYHKMRYNIPNEALHEILVYLNFKKIAGTQFISYWKKVYIKKYNEYDKNNPFFVLKKLQ